MKRRHLPEAARRRKLRHRYGVEPETYDKMFKEQGGVCAICYEAKSYKLYVDHNHKTGKIRSLLCAGCNTLVGSLENPKLEAAKAYIGKYNV